MEEQFKKLSDKDRSLLLKAPVLVSLLAASTDGIIDNKEKAAALELSHLRTFTAPPLLRPYYREVEKIFKPELEKLIQEYSPIDELQQNVLRKEVEKVYVVLEQLDEKLREEIKESLKSYAKHVGDIHRNFLEYFVFPMNIPGITD